MQEIPKKVPPFSQDVEALTEHIRKHWDGIDLLKPKGWDALSGDYCDFDGIAEWEENEKDAQEAEFDGFDDTTGTSFNFVARTSLPHVMYDDKCQDRDPLQTLIGAAIGYGMLRGAIFQKTGDRELLSSALTFLERSHTFNKLVVDSLKRIIDAEVLL